MRHIALNALSAVFLIACGPSSEATREDKLPEHVEGLSKYEVDFQPSDYDPDVGAILEQDKKSTENDQEALVDITSKEPVEFVPGFRVQILSSSSIDQANAAKLEAEALFPEQWFYLVYDAPTYKIRAGDFVQRFEADKFARQLAEHGYRDAWIVPERVYKNPPKRSMPEQKVKEE